MECVCHCTFALPSDPRGFGWGKLQQQPQQQQQQQQQDQLVDDFFSFLFLK